MVQSFSKYNNTEINWFIRHEFDGMAQRKEHNNLSALSLGPTEIVNTLQQQLH